MCFLYKNYNIFIWAVLFVFLTINANSKQNSVIAIYQKPVSVNIDLNGDKNDEKVIIEQKKVKKINLMKITVFDREKEVYKYEWQDKDSLIWYVQSVKIQQTPVSNEYFREMLFIITSTGTNYLNILCWESHINESDVYQKAMSKTNMKYKGRYRLLKTDIQISTPYD